MLWRHLELSADVVFHKLSEKGIVLIKHQIIKSYSRTYEYFLDIRKIPKLAQKRQIIRMVNFEIRTWLGTQTLPVLADSSLQLLLAGGLSEIGCRPAHIVNISLKILILCDTSGLFYYGFVAAYLYDPSLMKGKRTEITSAKTPAIADQRKLNFCDRWHTALRFIGRMIGSLVRKCIDIVHLLRRKWLLGDILHNIYSV